MTIATPGTYTCVELDWAVIDLHDGHLRHVTKIGGWSFTVRERQSSTVLTAHHRDGRGGVTDYNTVDQAKAAALDAMHPSEAMAWHSEDLPLVGTVHTASWGHLYFAAITTDDGQLRFGYRVDGDLSDEVVTLPNLREVQKWATGVLIEHYGPLRPVIDVPLPEATDNPAERLSAAFSAVPGLADVDADDIRQALNRAGLRLAYNTPLHRGIADPVTRLSRALYAAHGISLGYDEATELLRRAGLTLS